MTERGRKITPRTGLHHLEDDDRDRGATKPAPIEDAGAAETLLPWFLLKSVPGIGNHLFKRLIDRFGKPQNRICRLSRA
jgi:hypothetical protein